jgi:glycosyltransferase involved in cell wall biosynthesis
LNVTVVIPTYNRASLVCRAVDSALAAIRPGDEVIVVDDGSTDDTGHRLRRYANRVRHLRVPHAGVSAARNRGVRESRAPLVAFLDSDDEWMPDKLELQRALMAGRPEVLFCFSDFGLRRRNGAEVRRYFQNWHRDPRGWEEILGPPFPYSALAPLPAGREDFRIYVGDLYPTHMRGDYVCTCSVVVRREKAAGALHFTEGLQRYEDWECWGRLARAGLAAYMDTETLWNYDHDGPRLNRADESYCETARLSILERLWGRDPDFLAKHGEQFREVLTLRRRARARALLALGRTREAREELRRAGSWSIRERTLASLPGSLTRTILAVRQRLRRGRRAEHEGDATGRRARAEG